MASDELAAADADDVPLPEGLDSLAEKLKPRRLEPVSAAALGDTIDELTDQPTETYANSDGSGINRVAVLADDSVRVLMLTTRWKWRGPYSPDDREEWLADRGYQPVPEVDFDAE